MVAPDAGVVAGVAEKMDEVVTAMWKSMGGAPSPRA